MPGRLSLFAALACVACGGCTQMGTAIGLGTRDLAADEKAVIAQAVGRLIKDPASATFRWAKFPVGSGSGDVNYCAAVNARSALPGYSGDQLYIVVVGTENGRVKSAVVGAIHGGNDKHVVRTLCKRYGLDPDAAV